MPSIDDKSSQSVFLCHNSKDKPIVRRLGALLKTNGIRPFIDEVELDGGCDWQQALEDALTNSRAVVVCIGPSDLGRWQAQEIKIVVQQRIEAGLTVIPLILPTCVEKDPQMPLWLRASANILDLRRDETDLDPFARLLKSIDERDPTGHYRPSVLILRNENEQTSAVACERVISECSNLLHRVRVIHYSEVLLEQHLKETLPKADVLVSLLSPDSYDRLPGATFAGGIAAGAKQLALDAGVQTIQWRAEEMKFPEDPVAAEKFRNTEIDSYLPANLTRFVVQSAVSQFVAPVGHEDTQPAQGRRKTFLGFPDSGEPFARQIADFLHDRRIRCDSFDDWEIVLSRLKSGKAADTALIVILNKDPAWRRTCREWLYDLEDNVLVRLPIVGAYCHFAETKQDSEPVPVDLEQFQQYFGTKDFPKLAERINPPGGGE